MKPLALLALLFATAAHAQAPSPAQMGITSTTTPEVLQTLDSSKTWVPLGFVDPTTHSFSSAAGTDVRTFGCKADGTDQTACINNALTNAPDCVIIPAMTNGFYVAGTITVTKCLRGTVFNPSAAGASRAGTSFINCANTSAQACVVASQVANASTQIENLSIVGGATTPSNGSVGFQWTGGYNLTLTNVQVANFDTCAYIGPNTGASVGPFSLHGFNANFSRCRKHYVVQDGVAEAYFTGGRWGENGGGDYSSADDFYYGTKSTPGNGGSGPNSFILDTVQVNPGNQTVGCEFRWGGFQNTSGSFGANKIVNSHIEVLHGDVYTGANPQRGVICVDGTVPIVPEIKIIGNSFLEDGGTKYLPFFNINSAVGWGNEARVTVIGNHADGAISLNIHNMLFNYAPTILGNWFFGAGSFTAGDNSARAFVSDNVFFGGYTIAGQWAELYLANNLATLTDTATGVVFVAGDLRRSWTPVLAFSGASVGMTYTTQGGTIQRTAGGGYKAGVSIVLSSKGSSAGVASITGIPYGCASMPTISATVNGGLTGLTGAVSLQTTTGGGTSSVIIQSTPTGTSQLTDANFTNTSSISAVIECGAAS